jgi:hypothetical protein
MLVGFGHKSRSGKDTSCDYLVSKYGFVKISFAETLYDISRQVQSMLDKPVEKNPTLLQSLADTIKRVYGNNIFVNIVDKKIINYLSQGISVVISDVRHNEEFDMIRSHSGILIDINRKDRPIDRDPTHISEIQLDDASWDYVVNNNSSIDDLHESLDKILVKISHHGSFQTDQSYVVNKPFDQ